LVKLEKEGFVVSVPRGGTFVREISEKEIKEIYEIREALEILAIKLAVKRVGDEKIAQLNETCRMFGEAIQSKDIRLCHQHDLRFHRLLVEASGNERLSMMMENIHHQFSIMISRSPEYWSRADASLRDHLSIIEFLSKRDGQRAGEILSEHIRRGREALFR
jgi:DNA-binding GntR family transcriptional regulator